MLFPMLFHMFKTVMPNSACTSLIDLNKFPSAFTLKAELVSSKVHLWNWFEISFGTDFVKGTDLVPEFETEMIKISVTST